MRRGSQRPLTVDSRSWTDGCFCSDQVGTHRWKIHGSAGCRGHSSLLCSRVQMKRRPERRSRCRVACRQQMRDASH